MREYFDILNCCIARFIIFTPPQQACWGDELNINQFYYVWPKPAKAGQSGQSRPKPAKAGQSRPKPLIFTFVLSLQVYIFNG